MDTLYSPVYCGLSSRCFGAQSDQGYGSWFFASVVGFFAIVFVFFLAGAFLAGFVGALSFGVVGHRIAGILGILLVGGILSAIVGGLAGGALARRRPLGVSTFPDASLRPDFE